MTALLQSVEEREEFANTGEGEKLMRILIDMDGVMVNFVKGVDQLHDVELNWNEYSGGLNSSEFWKPINAAGMAFWENLEPYPWTPELIECLNIICPFNLYICSSPSREPCASGKVNWINQHLPEHLRRRFILTQHKHLLANKQTILIDDHDRNCLEFERNGGISILFPQPWNSLHGYAQSDDQKVPWIMHTIFSEVSKRANW